MKTAIFGTNDTARLAAFYLRADSIYTPVAYCIDSEYKDCDELDGLPVVAFSEIEWLCPPRSHKFFAPLYDNRLRELKTLEIKKKGYELVSYISTHATCWTKHIGTNCFIMEDNTIQPFVEIGNNVILWSGNHIGHHSKIGNNVFFSSHVVLSGHCVVEDYCWVGVNASIHDHTKLGEGSLIGMGATVLKDTQPWKKYYGCPAKEQGNVDKTW